METNPVHWFEIPMDDLDRAKKFYESVFDCKLNLLEMGPMKMLQFSMVNDTYGSAGALVKAEGYKPSYGGTIVYFGTNDIDGTLRKVIASGGKIIFSKRSIGEYGFIAQFEDSEGNKISLHSMT